MTLGEKIFHLRTINNVSQEQLARLLNISRQSISKWESNESIPQLDKILELSKIFSISTDDLINPEVVLASKPKHQGHKYFGTDGFRGESNNVLTSDHAYKIGRFLGWYFSSPKFKKNGERAKIVVGKDTRRSSYMYEFAIASGIVASGADVYLLHVTTTPSVSYVTRMDGFDCGIMITASHNPFYDNGIKVLNSNGEKLEDNVTSLIELYLDGDLKSLGISGKDLPFAKKDNIGLMVDYVSGRNRYIGYLISVAQHSYRNLKVGLDTANGASWMIAKAVFEALGASVTIINNNPNGLNINLEAGSTHIEHLVKLVKDNKLDIGFAFDGDADRCIAVDEKGEIVDGDKIMYLLAKKLKDENILDKNTIVTTVMSNKGLSKALKQLGINEIQTDVGDRFVYREMQNGGYRLGGEQSGHIILKKYATTGDGILTAIMVSEELLEHKQPLSKLVSKVKIYPQKLFNLRVINKDEVMRDKVVLETYEKLQKELGDDGRILLRKSGTEPVIRVMVEAENLELCDKYINRQVEVIKKRGFANE